MLNFVQNMNQENQNQGAIDNTKQSYQLLPTSSVPIIKLSTESGTAQSQINELTINNEQEDNNHNHKNTTLTPSNTGTTTTTKTEFNNYSPNHINNTNDNMKSNKLIIANTSNNINQQHNQHQNNYLHNHHQQNNSHHLPHNNSSTSIVALSVPHELTLSRRPSLLLQEILSTRRPSAIMTTIRTPSNYVSQNRPKMVMGSLHELDISGSSKSINLDHVSTSNSNQTGKNSESAINFRKKIHRMGDDALTAALSALYAKIIVILGVALPITEILTGKISTTVYQGFYVFLYLGSIAFVGFVYFAHMRTKAMFAIIKTYHAKTSNNNTYLKKRTAHFGSFYLRVGAISFGIGTMVYSGLEFGQYFELSKKPECTNFLIALTPAARMALSIIQMQFIFLNTTELDMARHKVICRFGLMHMIATNLCEWLYVLVEETKHEIHHFRHSGATAKLMLNTSPLFVSTIAPDISLSTNSLFNDALNNTNITAHKIIKRALEPLDCARTNIMGSLVQNASPFLFPCTIEYSLICAVILYEMWKKIKSLDDIERSRKNLSHQSNKKAHHFSVDCARAHRGMFAGILIIVMTIICLIMYFVLYDVTGYEHLAMKEVTICEILLYTVTTTAVLAAVIKMRDLKYQRRSTNDHHASSITLDCTLLVFAQTGVYVYGMFSIIGSYFIIGDDLRGGKDAFIAEIFSLLQTSVQTLFILNASWRRCRGAQQHRHKPGREIITFLLIANISMWFINTLIKGRAGFRPSHLGLYGIWAWTVITHVSMPLAIFYRFHSTICLFEIWKSAYKAKAITDH